MSKNIKGIVIDAGHGGNDPGTIHNDIVEKEYALKISNYMSQRFNELGVPNKLSRSTDITLNPNDRTNLIKSLYGNGNDVLVVSNHINAGGGDGAEIIYSLRNTDELSKLISDEFIKSGQNVRKYYQRRLPSNPSKDYYFILRDTANNESILVEYGFADSTKDDVNQIKNNWKDLTEAVIKAICSYIGVSYVAPQLVVDDTYYIVKKGDTLWNIAKRFKSTVRDIAKVNGIENPDRIDIGEKLYIPKYNLGIQEKQENNLVTNYA